MLRALSLFAVALVLQGAATAQSYYFDSYSVQDGLAQSKVHAAIQSADGYLWLGTASGLSRFDGNEFINYTVDDGLDEHGVTSIYEDSHGIIWLGHKGGEISRYRVGIGIERIGVDSTARNGDVIKIIEDGQQQVWAVSTGSGAILIENPTAELPEPKMTHYNGEEGFSDRAFDVVKSNDNTLYFVTDVGVKYYKDGAFDFFRIEQLPSYFQITALLIDNEGDYWFGTYNGGLYRYSQQMDSLLIYDVRDGLAHNWVSTLYQDAKGKIWAGTWGGGITRFDERGLTTFNTENGLPDNKIWSIKEDREGNLLIGTNENGLVLFKGQQFVSYTVKEGLRDNQVWAIVQDRNQQYWFGTNKGIAIYNPVNEVDRFRYLNQLENNLVSDQVRFLKEDLNGNIWIGTADRGVVMYNVTSNRLEYNPLINNRIRQGVVTAMEVDRQNNLWIGTVEGLVYYEVNNDKIDVLSQIHGLAGSDISSLYCDSKGVLWVGSKNKGLTSINDVTFQQVDLGSYYTPTTMVEDKNGMLWIGTEGQGVLVCDGEKVIQQLRMPQGLLSDFITMVNVDDNDNIWIGSNQGLNKFVKDESKIYTYTERIGFAGIEVKANASFKDRNGDLWLGTIKGAIQNNVNEERKNSLPPLTHITRFRVNQNDRELTEGVELNYTEKAIVFDFSSICLTNPDAVYYEVMLEGMDEDWQPATQQTFKSYSPLPPNSYTFKVRACNDQGIYNESPVTFSFIISPPFWQTWWFYLLVGILGAGILFVYIKIRERSLIREKKVLEEKVAERTEEVVQKNNELADKNKDIMDSIKYAKRIQDAILPSDELFTQTLTNTFVLFKPKDVVSGDFYWLFARDNKVWFAAVDCTGHGVPGAFMSIVGHNLLDKIVGEYNISEPAAILDRLNQGVAETLRQEQLEEGSGSVKDGMDMALVCYDKANNALQYAGAYNPLYIIRDGALLETKADRFPIGSFTQEENKRFTNHTVPLQKGDTIYLFSDGYVDQFGGEQGKKFKSRKFKELLLSIQEKSMIEQKTILNETLENWRGTIEQIDDVLIVGSRL